MSGLTGTGIFSQLAKGFGCQSPYRGALINSGIKRFETRLFVVLWVGIVLLGCFTCLQLYKLFEEGEQFNFVGKLPPPNTAHRLVPPENNLPISEVNAIPSMFHLKETKTLPPVADPQPQKNEMPVLPSPPAKTQQPIWQLGIQHSTLSEAYLAQQLAHAQEQLQAGHFELARQTYEHILAQDPHQVTALAGMLKSISGAHDQQQGYSNRLSQEIPNYLPDDPQDTTQVLE